MESKRWNRRRIMKPNSDQVSHWISRVKGGDAMAVERLWHAYFDRLVSAVRKRLQGQNRGPADEEDIALSVFNSFYDAAGKGRFPDLKDRDDLWRLLLTMSARKVIDQRRREQRQKRGGTQRIASLNSHQEDQQIAEVIGSEPSPEMVAMMEESVEQLFFKLGGGQLQELAGAKLEGYSNSEMAQRFGCSERTIERRLRLIREILEHEPIRTRSHQDHEPQHPAPRDD